MSSQKLLKMYNLNVSVAATPVFSGNFLSIDGPTNTPRTPEIVNSLVAMTNPFDAFMKPGSENNSPGSEESCSGTGSPLGSPTNSPPSVQHTRSQLIKEGLKLTIQTKRKQSGSDSKEDIEEFESKRTKKEELTEEDEERRKRRRERNKIAATKCRMKKREKTAMLVRESETLETQNINLKSQMQALEKERKKLMNLLSKHSATCVKAISTNVQNQTFEDFVEPFANGFDATASFNFETPTAAADFEIGSTNGTAMNPYGKDPNFAKILDDVTSTTNYSRSSFDRPFTFNDSSATTNYYQPKTRTGYKLSENRFDYQSEKKCAKDRQTPAKTGLKKLYAEEDGDVFRTSFPSSHDNDDTDCYKPNGIVDGNFLASRTDNIFGGGNDYVNAFGNNPLDNGCMA